MSFFSHIPRIPEPPVLKTDEDVLAYQYDSGRGVIHSIEQSFVAYLLKIFRDQPTLRILDIASGPGWIPVSIAKKRPTWEITGMDALPAMLTFAGNLAASCQTQIHWVHGTAEKLNFPSENFDVVICHFAFHEFRDPQACVNEMARVLKKGGSLIIQDLRRPRAFEFPVVKFLNILNSYTKPMQRQYLHCVQAAFTLSEMCHFFRQADLQPSLTSQCGMIVRTAAVKT